MDVRLADAAVGGRPAGRGREFRTELPRFLGDADPALPGVDPEAALVLQVMTHGPLWNTSPLWAGAGPAGRFAVISQLSDRDPGRCAVLDEAVFDSVHAVEHLADQRREHQNCPLEMDLVPRLLQSPAPHLHYHAALELRRGLPKATDREVLRSRCPADHSILSCWESRTKPRLFWSADERSAYKQLVAIATDDPDNQVREFATSALGGAHLGLNGPLPPSWRSTDHPEDGGCGGE